MSCTKRSLAPNGCRPACTATKARRAQKLHLNDLLARQILSLITRSLGGFRFNDEGPIDTTFGDRDLVLVHLTIHLMQATDASTRSPRLRQDYQV
ncbi:MAG: hypothetical protein ACI9BW_004736 [Gammaproteobacteria bacterium]|jgi:hypothetical protein